jgi:PIN domain nuclease of toxin-antitoxin system
VDILIDTQVLIWHLEGNAKLKPSYRALISDPINQILISVVSPWEIAIKLGLGKITLSTSLPDIFDSIAHSTSKLLPIEPDHILGLSILPQHHGDPFDRMIIAQALSEGTAVITTDAHFAAYGVTLL